jgi:hypothetical protein
VCRVVRPSSTQQQTERKQQPQRNGTPVQLSSLDRHEYDAEKEKSRKFRRVVSAPICCCRAQACKQLVPVLAWGIGAVLCITYAAHSAGRSTPQHA